MTIIDKEGLVMYELCNLNKENIKEFRKLEGLKQNFNILNKKLDDNYFVKYPFFSYLFRKRIKLLKYNGNFVGYIWVEGSDILTYNINSMYVIETINLTSAYNYLLNSFKGYTLLLYDCEKNSYNFSILENLGFKNCKGVINMEIYIEEPYIVTVPEFISFRSVFIGKDEELRCTLQNNIFYHENRIPLKIEDIYYDEMQDYYCNDGAVFIKHNEVYIGFGQIIKRCEELYVVNFGILPKYQHNGYGKLLLKYLLNIAFSKGSRKVKIKVSQDNLLALSLYNALGFKEISHKAKWYLKVI